jgi:ankyrin repeat protein
MILPRTIFGRARESESFRWHWVISLGKERCAMKCLLLLAVLLGGMWYVARAPNPDGDDDSGSSAASSPRACGELLEAARCGNLDGVRRLLGQGVPVGCRDECGNDALLQAAITGQTEVVKLLLAAGASIDTRTRFNATPLMVACLFGHDDTVEALVRSGADVNAHSSRGVTALMIAATRGNAELIGRLLAAGADPLLRDGSGQRAGDYLDGNADADCGHALAAAVEASGE